MILSILVPSLEKRQELFFDMLHSLGKLPDGVEILRLVDNGEITTGEKRNKLLNSAVGKYVWFVDDDDEVLNDAVNKIVFACNQDPDVITYNGFVTTNGSNREDFEIRLNHKYETIKKNGRNFHLRYPNHITPMKREIALQIGFPDITYQEDYIFARKLYESGLLKTEIIINENLYHYKYIKNK